MNIQTALLPHKHVYFSESTLALAGRLRKLLGEPRSIDELWSFIGSNADEWPSKPSFTQLVLAVDILFTIKQIVAAPDSRVVNASALPNAGSTP